MAWELLAEGIDFGEGPRWHDGRLWYSDFYQHTICSVGSDGVRRVEHEHHDRQPSGLGWLPDGRLLFVSMAELQVLRREHDGSVVIHGDMSRFASTACNDMVVARNGDAYVGNFGFDLNAGDKPTTTCLVRVSVDGEVAAVADDLFFPNGSVILRDTTLVVGESFGGRYTAFDIGADGSLVNRRVWAEVAGMAPDGCAADADGAIWFSDAIGSQVVRVREGGEITDKVETPDHTYCCMLGGDDGHTLFAFTCAGSHPDTAAGTGTGKIWTMRVDVPRSDANLP